MKANFYSIGLSIVALPSIYFINGSEHHWLEFVPLTFLSYALIVGCWSAWRNRKEYEKN